MTSLRAEHGGALGILLLLHDMNVFYQETFPKEFTVYIDNSEVVRRGKEKVAKLGIKQQLVLDYDLWATTERLREVLPCKNNENGSRDTKRKELRIHGNLRWP